MSIHNTKAGDSISPAFVYLTINRFMMNKIRLLIWSLLIPVFCTAQSADSTWITTHYTKKELYIVMRDGVRLFTTIYQPIDNTKEHPILMNRTPYAVSPYGEGKFRAYWNTPYSNYFKENYIIVLQDVRGKFMSEGEFMDVRPFMPGNDKTKTDEASDTYDTIDWLINNVKGNNKRVGIFGISYPGYYAMMGALCGHPALKAASPQAPVTDWFMGDDFHHNGAFMQMDAFSFYTTFGKPRPVPTQEWAPGFQYYSKDNYKFYLSIPTLKDLAYYMGKDVKFWGQLYDHPNYDKWWQDRNTRNYAQYIPKNVATLVVGGLFDAEDCFGAWNLYKAIEEKATNNNKLVMGPWSHGGWAKSTGEYLGNVRFGKKTAEWYQQNVELPFFEYYLQDKGDISKLKEATVFFSGANEWRTFPKWPADEVQYKRMYLQVDGSLSYNLPYSNGVKYVNKYTSNPNKPVPYTEDVHFKRTTEYMTDDQRFAARRPDVLVYETDTLRDDVTLGGPVVADLFTAISSTDADFVVKIIDVLPDNFSYSETMVGNGKNYPMGGYQMLVRGEVMRGKYRNSFSDPQPFTPGKLTEVKFKIPDVAHVFKKGHRIMVQVQSSWFPLVDRNPQKFIDIYKCDKTDFVNCDIEINCGRDNPSSILLPIINNQ